MSRVAVPVGLDAGLSWHFSDPLGEQRRMLAGQGVHFLANRGVITITGPDRLGWLNDLTTAKVRDLAPHTAITALVTSPTGHIQYVLQGVDDGECFWAWTEADALERLTAWAESMKFWTQIQIQPRPDVMVAWIGAELSTSAGVIERASEVAGGTEIFLPRERAAQLTEDVGSWAWEALRIAAGIPRIGVDTDDRTLPNELGLYATTLGKGCYPGQEVVARVHNVGRPPRRLVRYLLDGTEDLPEPGSQVAVDGKAVGFLGSVAQHWELGPIGLGLIRRETGTMAVLDVAGIAAGQEVLVDPDVGEHFRPAPGLRLLN